MGRSPIVLANRHRLAAEQFANADGVLGVEDPGGRRQSPAMIGGCRRTGGEQRRGTGAAAECRRLRLNDK